MIDKLEDNRIVHLATIFRCAIDKLKKEGRLQFDPIFYRFPSECCGDTTYLLAVFLLQYGIKTFFYSAEKNGQSHAWLVVYDSRIREPKHRTSSFPLELWEVVRSYGVENPEENSNAAYYVREDLEDGLIIDITGDQFFDYNIPIYVGKSDNFHSSFDLIEAIEINDLPTDRLKNLYYLISTYINN